MQIESIDLEKRRGTIVINREFVANMNRYQQYFTVLFSNFFPIQIDRDNFSDAFIFKGLSPLFKECNLVGCINEYEPKFKVDVLGKVSLEFKLIRGQE